MPEKLGWSLRIRRECRILPAAHENTLAAHGAAFPRATVAHGIAFHVVAVHEDTRRPRSRRPREAAGHEDWAPLTKTSRNDLS